MAGDCVMMCEAEGNRYDRRQRQSSGTASHIGLRFSTANDIRYSSAAEEKMLWLQ